MKDKHKIWMIGGIIAIIAICITVFFFVKGSGASAQKSVETYVQAIKKKDYEAAYETIANKKDWKKADFIKRVKNIYTGINMKNMNIEFLDESSKGDTTSIRYKMQMDTVGGKLSYEHKVNVVDNENGYQLQWSLSQIYPTLTNTGSIRVEAVEGVRGSILDRNGEPLASEGIAYNVGFVARSIDHKEKAIQDMADILGISKEGIQRKLEATWIQDGMFVPIKKISAQRKLVLSEALNQVDGASIQQTSARVYPYGEMLGHVSGYVQNINAEELKKHKNKGYDASSVIGKDGLELQYEKDLKPTSGYRISVVDANEDKVTTIASKAKKNGKDVTTTIDIHTQQALLDQLKEDAGAGVMMDSHTGEVLALVSTSSYDPNAFVLGMSSDEWNQISTSTSTPLLNRATSLYSPGSTFKAVSGAIGIDTGTIDATTTYKKTDKWQKDASWGDNYVTTTQLYSEPSNLLNAYIHSDNIYFAQLSDAIGKKNIKKYLDKVGFQSALDFALPTQTSSYGKLANDQQVSAAGYGQGELLISPLHVTALYTAYVNDGTIVKPYIIYNEGKTSILAKDAYKKETANIIFDDLKQTMDSFGANPTNAAGKTGTAQVSDGEKEIGWICTVHDAYALSIMVDNTKDIGQSHYVIPKAQTILQTFTK